MTTLGRFCCACAGLITEAAASNDPAANAPSLGHVRCRTFILSLHLSNSLAVFQLLSLSSRVQAPGPSNTISMRLFFARSSGVSFDATGWVSPNPFAEIMLGLMPCDSKYATTLSARREDRSMLLAMPDRCSAGPTG